MNKLKFSEETILSVSKTTLANANAHAHQAGLAEFGISQQLLDDFEANIQAAEALPNEVSSRIDLRDMTRGKDEALEACYQWGRMFRARLQLAFGNTSAQAKAFPVKNSKPPSAARAK